MTNLWNIRAELKSDGHVRRVHYKIGRVREYAFPSFDTILFWCKDACEQLLSELKEKEADKRDLEYVEREIMFLNEYQVAWEANHKKKS